MDQPIAELKGWIYVYEENKKQKVFVRFDPKTSEFKWFKSSTHVNELGSLMVKDVVAVPRRGKKGKKFELVTANHDYLFSTLDNGEDHIPISEWTQGILKWRNWFVQKDKLKEEEQKKEEIRKTEDQENKKRREEEEKREQEEEERKQNKIKEENERKKREEEIEIQEQNRIKMEEEKIRMKEEEQEIQLQKAEREETDPTTLLGYLSSSHGTLRRKALDFFGNKQVKDGAVIEGILQCLKSDQDSHIRIQAAYSLAKLDTKDNNTIDVLICLLQEDQDNDVRAAVVDCFATLNVQSTSVISVLVKCLQTEKEDQNVLLIVETLIGFEVLGDLAKFLDFRLKEVREKISAYFLSKKEMIRNDVQLKYFILQSVTNLLQTEKEESVQQNLQDLKMFLSEEKD